MEVEKIWKGWKVEKEIGEGSFGKVFKIVRCFVSLFDTCFLARLGLGGAVHGHAARQAASGIADSHRSHPYCGRKTLQNFCHACESGAAKLCVLAKIVVSTYVNIICGANCYHSSEF